MTEDKATRELATVISVLCERADRLRDLDDEIARFIAILEDRMRDNLRSASVHLKPHQDRDGARKRWVVRPGWKLCWAVFLNRRRLVLRRPDEHRTVPLASCSRDLRAHLVASEELRTLVRLVTGVSV